MVCSTLDGGYSKPVFSLLLDRGASISDLDSEGRSCLHLCLQCAGGINRFEQEPEGLIYLVAEGANIWARDHAGRSVSHVVYSRAVQFGSSDADRRLGSYRRDLWDLVLAANGYDVSKVRGDIRRVGWHPTKRYTRTDFRRLWAGREHLCPYPEDLNDARSDDGTRGEIVEAEEGDDEASHFAHGSQGAYSSDADQSDADNLDVDDPDADDTDADDTDVDDPDVDDPDVGSEIDSDSDDSDANSDSSDKIQAGIKCCKVCKMSHIGGAVPQCCHCGWSSSCRDPNCGYCSVRNDLPDTSMMREEISPDLQEEDCAMPEAPSHADPTAEVWAFGANHVRFDLPDHLGTGTEIQHWLGELPRPDETRGDGSHGYSMPVIELDNPWVDD